MAYRLYCLECNRVIGESAEEADVSRDRGTEVCQACAQHRGPKAKPKADRATHETKLTRAVSS